MKHHLEWKGSTLNIRCWGCNEILISISTDGPSINFDSLVDSLEINCPNCHTTCGYYLLESNPEIFRSHDWDSDVDNKDFEGQTGEENRALWRDYKWLLFDNESTTKFFDKEFNIVGNYLEFLSEKGIDGSNKVDGNIDGYIKKYKEFKYLAKSRKQLFRRAINRFYRLVKANKYSS